MAAGPAAILSWVIGAVAIVLLALVHVELGGMFPVEVDAMIGYAGHWHWARGSVTHMPAH